MRELPSGDKGVRQLAAPLSNRAERVLTETSTSRLCFRQRRLNIFNPTLNLQPVALARILAAEAFCGSVPKQKRPPEGDRLSSKSFGGAEEGRTPGLRIAKASKTIIYIWMRLHTFAYILRCSRPKGMPRSERGFSFARVCMPLHTFKSNLSQSKV